MSATTPAFHPLLANGLPRDSRLCRNSGLSRFIVAGTQGARSSRDAQGGLLSTILAYRAGSRGSVTSGAHSDLAV